MDGWAKGMAAGALVWAALGGVGTAQAQVWERVCGEGEACPVLGSRAIRYGADGQYHYGVATRVVTCSNEVFGDPAPGVPKTCDGYYTAEERGLFEANAAKDQRIAALEEEARTIQAELDEAEREVERLQRALRRAERRGERGGVRLEFGPVYRERR
ncbi:MAG TPA: hypothetical protein VGN97_20270 [Mesorhizobium sp.]|jgi:hypothetical protein|nr:hypothetical protein [Mesorhizobium sp.]